jgi:hypothetical protein
MLAMKMIAHRMLETQRTQDGRFSGQGRMSARQIIAGPKKSRMGTVSGAGSRTDEDITS